MPNSNPRRSRLSNPTPSVATRPHRTTLPMGSRSYTKRPKPSMQTSIPPPPPPPYRLLIAKWTAMEFLYAGTRCRRLRHSYTLVVKPDGPVAIGGMIRILALSTVAYDVPPKARDGYDTYDPHVFGRITDIRRTEDGMGRMTVQNLCRGNMVEVIEIDFPYLPEILGRRAGRREMMEIASEGVEASLELLTCVRTCRVDPGTECAGPDCCLDSIINA